MRFDRKGRRAQFLMARAAESNYHTRLRQIAQQIDLVVKGFSLSDLTPAEQQQQTNRIVNTLRSYAEVIEPWAVSVAKYMVADVSRRNAAQWKQNGKDMGLALQVELEQAPTGGLFTSLMNEQVRLIKSLPLDAAERVHMLTTKGMVSGTRAKEIAAEILRTGEVSASRARLIARTEVARTASNFTQARARFAGSDGYIWRTSGDGDVRETHKAMEGKYVRWDTPPKTDTSLGPYHAGCGPNCRCYPEPIF